MLQSDEEFILNKDVFDQLIDLDEDDPTFDFSKGMVEAYFTQAGETFKKMDNALYDPSFQSNLLTPLFWLISLPSQAGRRPGYALLTGSLLEGILRDLGSPTGRIHLRKDRAVR